MFDVDVETERGATRAWEIRFPRGGRAQEVVLSPRADRLAWVFYFGSPYPGRNVTKERRATCEIWISCLDGSRMHLAGYQSDYQDVYDVSLNGLKWLPDGKRLSFIYADALYTIPAD